MPTEFQERVYAAVRRIPRGRVTTYRRLADRIGCNSGRAVGQALKRNPYAPQTPCHRVIASDLTLGGFEGQGQGEAVAKKQRLLAEEGVAFRNGKLADPARVHP